jgi:hypothetical protein
MYKLTAVHKGDLDTAFDEDHLTMSSAIAAIAEMMTVGIEAGKTRIRLTLTNTRTLKELAWVQL